MAAGFPLVPAQQLEEGIVMDQELREIEKLTSELLRVLEGFWSECRAGALSKARYLGETQQPPDL
jgi:hypothetical protein